MTSFCGVSHETCVSACKESPQRVRGDRLFGYIGSPARRSNGSYTDPSNSSTTGNPRPWSLPGQVPSSTGRGWIARDRDAREPGASGSVVTRFLIVPERSAVMIDASSSVHPIRTRTDGLEGYVELDIDADGHIDVDAGVSGELSLAVERLKSGNPLEDRELRRRIDARRFPTITGRITEVHTSGNDGRHCVRGDVTFRGMTRTHEDDVTFTLTSGGELKIDGRSTFDVRDFGMQPPKILMLRVHPEVTVAIDAVATTEVTAP